MCSRVLTIERVWQLMSDHSKQMSFSLFDKLFFKKEHFWTKQQTQMSIFFFKFCLIWIRFWFCASCVGVDCLFPFPTEHFSFSSYLFCFYLFIHFFFFFFNLFFVRGCAACCPITVDPPPDTQPCKFLPAQKTNKQNKNTNLFPVGWDKGIAVEGGM